MSWPGLIEVEPQGGKVARAAACTPEVESGNVYLPLPDHNPWVLEFIAELGAFPNGANDDRVDAFSQGLLRLSLRVTPKFNQKPGKYGGRRM